MRSKGIKTPAIVVALGTTATKAMKELCEQLLAMEQDDRDAVAIVTIDTDTARPDFETLKENNPGKFHAFQAAIRVPPNIDQADALPRSELRHIKMPNYTPRYYDYGAGGIRNHGHVALTYRMDEVYSALRDALAAIKLLPAGQGHKVTDSVQVYVVAFLGGGTGSGIVADIGVILRDLLRTDMQGQRLSLFGILPLDHFSGNGSNEESWRKSNATAAILEVMAAGLAAGGVRSGFYRKRMLNNVYTIPKAPIFNEVYLIGRTNLGSVDQVAYMVGLDLFQRITDASGVGDLTRSQSPDFKDLQGVDDRGLPTNFSASCPVEVRFPLLEVCDAFAHLAAGHLLLLENFVGNPPPEPTPEPDTQGVWESKWNDYAIPSETTASTLGPSLLTFTSNQFVGVSPNRLNSLWSQAKERWQRYPAQLSEVCKQILKAEMERIQEANQERMLDAFKVLKVTGSLSEDCVVSYGAIRLTYLSLLRQEYQHVLGTLEQNPPKAPTADRPTQQEHNLHQLLPFNIDRLLPPNPITESMEQGRAHGVAAAYNGIIEEVYYFHRYTMLTDLLKRLEEQTRTLYESIKRDMSDAHAQEEGQAFITTGQNSLAWQGKLGREHPHEIGLFDLDRFRENQERIDLPMLPAMVGMFRWALADPDRGTSAIGNCLKPLDIEALKGDLRSDRWMGECIRYLNKARRQDRAELAGVNLSEADKRDALAADSVRVPERVLEFFRERFRAFFAEKNLFDLLAVGYAAETNRTVGQAWREVPNLMRMHLEHARNVLRLMLQSDPHLWRQGAAAVRATLYLGVNWHEGTAEEGWVDQLARSVPFQGLGIGPRSPQIVRDDDPHRLQLNFALHAISVRTIPTFFMRDNSMTAEYISSEYAWLGWRESGRQQQNGPHPGTGVAGATPGQAQSAQSARADAGPSVATQAGAQSTYGSAVVPTHSSEEMERLTLDPHALPNQWGLNLLQRLLRDTPTMPTTPEWNIDPDEDDRDDPLTWTGGPTRGAGDTPSAGAYDSRDGRGPNGGRFGGQGRGPDFRL